jgi:hypothetical protein
MQIARNIRDAVELFESSNWKQAGCETKFIQLSHMEWTGCWSGGTGGCETRKQRGFAEQRKAVSCLEAEHKSNKQQSPRSMRAEVVKRSLINGIEAAEKRVQCEGAEGSVSWKKVGSIWS